MGNWTFSEGKAFLKFQFGQNADLESVDGRNMYGVWWNTAYRDLTERHQFWSIKKRFYFPELEDDVALTTTDGTPYISAPTRMLFPQEVYDETNNRWLKWIPWREYIKKTDRSNTSAEGEPARWTRRSSSDSRYLYFHPTPDTDDETLRLYYRKRMADLTGTGLTLIGEEWDEVILILAAIKGNMWMNDWVKVEKLKGEFMDMIKDRADIYTPEELARRGNFRLHPAYIMDNR